MLKWLLDRLHASENSPPLPRIELEDAGFAIVFPDGRCSSIRWKSVTRLVTFKRDNFSTDEVILSFEVAERPGIAHEVSEEWPGFRNLFSALQSELGITPNWYDKVMQPPFATNFQVLLPAERALTPSKSD